MRKDIYVGRRGLLSALLLISLVVGLCFGWTGCGNGAPFGRGSESEGDGPGSSGVSTATGAVAASVKERTASVSGLTYTSSLQLKYATQYAVDFFEEGPFLVTVSDGRQYLVVPFGASDKSGTSADDLLNSEESAASVSKDVTVLQAPVSDVYLAGSASMDFFVACGAMDCVRFSALKESAWEIPEAVKAMKSGDIVYAGKYSAPDYELLTSRGCGLAVENTMIYHSPAVIEKLEKLDIPVFIDASSRESTPQGRMEWVKLYGLLTNCSDAAEQAFTEQEQEFLALEKTQSSGGSSGLSRSKADASGSKTGESPEQSSSGAVKDADILNAAPTVAFFALRANGTVTVRRATDYIPYMIQLAGGKYAFPNLGVDDGAGKNNGGSNGSNRGDNNGNRSTETISMEEFFRTAKDADFFVYNSSIEGERTSLASLLQDAPVLADCKAVRNGNVYCTTADLYQHSMSQGTFVKDLHTMLSGGAETDMTYLYKLK